MYYLNVLWLIDSRLNGLNVNPSKVRPRIPTPDVAKDAFDLNDTNGTYLFVVLIKMHLWEMLLIDTQSPIELSKIMIELFQLTV